ncbi:MerR family transcriptional regulator [Intestinibacter sp.]
MLIKDVCLQADVTKKAVEYYIEKKLITPTVLENGYREFDKEDCIKLKKISMFRKLGLSIDEIKRVMNDNSNEELQKIAVQKELKLKFELAKKSLIDEIGSGKNIDEIISDLDDLEKNKTITEKLLDAFPGYYGRFIALHFSTFLNEPISTKEQQEAYNEIVDFLDKVPDLNMPNELQKYIIESTKNITTKHINKINEDTIKSIENPEKFFEDNKEILEEYLKYKQSEEYKLSPVYKIQEILKQFTNTSGYNDVFIPAMKRLSTSYAEYYKQLEEANEKFMKAYPDVAKMYMDGEI